jgi:Arc/MetJ-type ribon-helix-helix transcriptional regulator
MSSYAGMASSINISLTEPLADFVESQTEAGNFRSPAEYIGELVREECSRQQQRLEAHLLEALSKEDEAIEIPQHILENGDIVGFLEDRASQHA